MLSKEEIEINHTKDSFCVRIPLITEQELKRIDDNLDSITDELTKQIIHDKDLAIAQHIIQKQKERIDQLENQIQAKEMEHKYDVNMINEVKGNQLNYTKKIRQLEQEKEFAYWKGYIQKQQEAMEICKMCKYRKQYFERNAEEAKQYFEKKVAKRNVKRRR